MSNISFLTGELSQLEEMEFVFSPCWIHFVEISVFEVEITLDEVGITLEEVKNSLDVRISLDKVRISLEEVDISLVEELLSNVVSGSVVSNIEFSDDEFVTECSRVSGKGSTI